MPKKETKTTPTKAKAAKPEPKETKIVEAPVPKPKKAKVVLVVADAPEAAKAVKAPAWEPTVGEKFDLMGQTASIDEAGVVTIHELKNGCQTERVTELTAQGAAPLDKGEAFRRLAG